MFKRDFTFISAVNSNSLLIFKTSNFQFLNKMNGSGYLSLFLPALVRKRFAHNCVVDWHSTNDDNIFNLIFIFLSGQGFSQFFQSIIGSQNIAIFWFLGDRSGHHGPEKIWFWGKAVVIFEDLWATDHQMLLIRIWFMVRGIHIMLESGLLNRLEILSCYLQNCENWEFELIVKIQIWLCCEIVNIHKHKLC